MGAASGRGSVPLRERRGVAKGGAICCLFFFFVKQPSGIVGAKMHFLFWRHASRVNGTVSRGSAFDFRGWGGRIREGEIRVGRRLEGGGGKPRGGELARGASGAAREAWPRAFRRGGQRQGGSRASREKCGACSVLERPRGEGEGRRWGGGGGAASV